MTDEQQNACVAAINALPSSMRPADLIVFFLNIFNAYGFDETEATATLASLAFAVNGGAYAELRTKSRDREKMN